ncbi:MAG: hypothetical protein ACLFT4_01245 [Bacteroidales bacterium]
MDKNKEKIVFFHVGLPKTASTFLQIKVFPKFKGIEYIKKHDFKKRDRIIANSSYNRILLSIELDLDVEEGRRKARSVAENYPNSYPIVVLRKHGSWLKSKYKYFLRKHGTKDFQEYYHPEKTETVLKDKNLLFFQKIKYLEETFPNPPLVLFQEELKNEPLKVIDLLASYVGASYSHSAIKVKTVKKAYSEKQLKLVRKFNRIYRFDKSGIKSGFGKFAYKKWSAFLLHSVAYIGALLPEKQSETNQLIPSETIQKVNEAFAGDWDKCLEYSKKQREKLFL